MGEDVIEVKGSNEERATVKKGTTVGDVLKALYGKVDSRWIAAKVNGDLYDLSRPIYEAVQVEPVAIDSPEGLDILRHSTSHVMAQAVKELFPEAKVAIGPSIENGFYYDFDVSKPFTPEDLEKIEARMAEIVQEHLPFQRREMSRSEAIEFFRKMGETYKVELLENMEDGMVSLYQQGGFVDLCRGPHIPHTGYIKAFKLTGVAGAYWRGDERNPMLQRIYGTAFSDKKTLKKYLNFLEEAKRRDHRRLGRELDLFQFNEEVGPGMVIYHPKGAIIRQILEAFEKKEHLRRGYQIVIGPTLLKTELWKRSGHFDNYRENMYFTEVEGQSYGIKPMNCIAHMLIYKSKVRSYRDLPIRYFELGTVHRHEKSGVLHGLLRVRQFTQDDAHILCTPEQLQDEIKGVIDFVIDVMGIFGFPYEMEVSTRPEKSIGTDEDWDRATSALINALNDVGIPYEICEGEGAFYGPKIDVKLRDALDRRWQCATIQCDFTLPERFDLTYVGPDGQKHRPVMLHRVILGAMERFLGILIEQTWLAPVQAVVMTVTDNQLNYARKVYQQLVDAEVRVELDDRNEKLGFKIREAQLQKVPYMVIVGDREVEAGSINPRRRDGK
ncbi:MAG: threonine--tRNA ligase, partial [Deltaproteobacteria bacterium]|nr:threonine--tRNA ligase [Deltaproteobacteria bacterium]